MDETNELLMHLYETADMGVKSTKKLLKILKNKDNKIKGVLENELKQYENFYKEAKNLLNKHSIKPCKKLMANMVANTTMQLEIDKDNSDSKIAEILSRGFIMGVTGLKKKISDYEKEASRKIIRLAKNLVIFQEKEIENLKEYL
ncbi:MAG: hypothetical protein IJB82_01685 [Bacilli bacterium]|nr:hypothetical protein [Bacilli bacterium]